MKQGTLALLFSVALLFSSNVFSLDDLGPKKKLFRVNSIKIEGLKKVEREAILEKITTRKGMDLDNYRLRKDIERIYSLKYFEHVEAHSSGNNLIFKVREKPIITTITFKGNSEIDEDDLSSQLSTQEFSILDVNTVQSDAVKLEKFYEEKGFFIARVTHEIKRISAENVEVIYRIKEFDKVRVKKITFLRNKAIGDAELKKIMETREEGLFSFISNSGSFREFNFQTDVERIKYFYKTKGYLQVNIGTPEVTVSEDKRWIFITVPITEGPLFTVNEITYQGEVLFEESQLLENTKLKSEENYSEQLLREDIQKLTEMYQDEGYAFANVLRTLNLVPGENKVNVEFSFEKGRVAHFGKITVKGNVKTRDKIIRRELLIKEGQKFSGSALRRSKENVNRLGFFEANSVVFNTISPPSGADDVLDVEISIKETNTGQISLGAGYSTASKEFFQASIAENNFRGKGQNLKLSLSLSNGQQTYNLGFTEPYFLNSKWSLGGDLFRNQNETSDSFSFRKTGGDIRVGYPIFDYTRLFLTYKLEESKIKSQNDPTIDPNVENGWASSLRASVIHDKRNNRLDPSSGYYINYSLEYTGLGFDHKWWMSEADLRYYHKVYGDLVFRSRWHTSKLKMVSGREIPRSEKFFLGGSRNLRGFGYEDIGPKETFINPDTGLPQVYNVRSLFATYASFELEHPLSREAGLKWVVFFDMGDAGDIDNIKLHKNYGFGFRWFSPIGVLRFEFGYPLGGEAEGRGSQFHFDIGQLF